MLRRAAIRFNNWIVRMRRVRVAPPNLLVLLPHCLQCSLCRQNVVHDLADCKRCGQCDIAALLALRDERKVPFRIARGGREALEAVKDPSVKAVVAVACEKELFPGIYGSFPKPVLAILNDAPQGPCHDTRVDVAKVRAALQFFLG